MPDDETPRRDEIVSGADELSAEERRAFRELPREASPSDVLEARTVRALRAAGLIDVVSPRRSFPLTPGRVAAALAACLVLFAGGFALGRAGSAHSSSTPAQPAGRNATNAIARLQDQRSNYFAALESLAQGTAAADVARASQLREAARQTLRAAAEHMLRVAPEDALATGILQAMDLAAAAKVDSTSTGARRVVWF